MLWSVITQLNSILFKYFGVEWDRFDFLSKFDNHIHASIYWIVTMLTKIHSVRLRNTIPLTALCLMQIRSW